MESGVVLGQKYINGEKTNEIPVFQEMLLYVDIKGKTITADAMHCQKDTCEMIIAKGGNYVFGLKGNHKLLKNDVEAFFANPENNGRTEIFEAPIDKKNGRVTQRIFYRALDPMIFNGAEKWKGVKSIFAVRRIVTTKHGVTDDICYYISSLDSSPESLLATVRDHWKIESTCSEYERSSCVTNVNANSRAVHTNQSCSSRQSMALASGRCFFRR